MPMITTTTAAWRLGPDYPSKKSYLTGNNFPPPETVFFGGGYPNPHHQRCVHRRGVSVMVYQEKKKKEVPIWEKYVLTIEEASAYFQIGRDKLYRIIDENPDADFILLNGTRKQIKRVAFERYVDRLSAI